MENEPSADILKAAQITVVFSMMYGATFINVLISKKRALQMARAAKKEYDRYTSPYMRSSDRLQANFLEWSPVFLGLMWSLAATNNLGSSSMVCWAYIWLRALYIVLILSYGVTANGLNVALWASTFPAYACLTYLGVRGIQLLFF
jgi:uncharacterized MAPEG superfamily protein